MTKFKSDRKGFTLIELLVVIAIIGILSAVVLASLNQARNKAQDAKVISQMSSIRAAAELAYNGLNYGVSTLGGNCENTTPANGLLGNENLVTLMTPANWPGSAAPTCASGAGAGGDITEWSMVHVLNNGTDYACIDSSGASKIVTTDVVTAGQFCDETTSL